MRQGDPKNNLIRGAIWTVGTRWAIKGVGFLNTVIMARLLMPEDYGIVALATLTIGFVQVFLDFGARVALLRKHEVTTEEINSAWTLSLIQGIIATLLVITLTPLAADFFHEARLNIVIPILALSFLFSNAVNIGVTLALKEYNFNLDFKIQVTSKIASVIVTILAGMVLLDYRALMLGVMIGYIFPMVLSYRWHPYRPRWDTSKVSEIWAVTKWLMLANIGSYLLERIDQFAAGRISDTRGFGLYNVGADLGQLPVAEVGPAMLRAILPVLSSIQHDIERTRNAVVKTITALNTIIWALGIGFMAISTQATEVILGTKWVDATPYVAVFALVIVLKTTSAPARSFLIVLGHTRDQSIAVWLDFAGFLISALLLVPLFHLLGLAYARAVGSFIYLVITLITAKLKCGLPLGRTVANLMRPITGAIMMGLLVKWITEYAGGHFTGMLAGIASGVIIYTLWCLSSWWLFGKPEGLESTVLDKLSELARKRKSE
jgi:lipopolysaccharide exporter